MSRESSEAILRRTGCGSWGAVACCSQVCASVPDSLGSYELCCTSSTMPMCCKVRRQSTRRTSHTLQNDTVRCPKSSLARLYQLIHPEDGITGSKHITSSAGVCRAKRVCGTHATNTQSQVCATEAAFL